MGQNINNKIDENNEEYFRLCFDDEDDDIQQYYTELASKINSIIYNIDNVKVQRSCTVYTHLEAEKRKKLN